MVYTKEQLQHMSIDRLQQITGSESVSKEELIKLASPPVVAPKK
jgi:hypothetical protein